MNKKYIITRVWLFSMRRNYTEHKGWDKKKILSNNWLEKECEFGSLIDWLIGFTYYLVLSLQ